MWWKYLDSIRTFVTNSVWGTVPETESNPNPNPNPNPNQETNDSVSATSEQTTGEELVERDLVIATPVTPLPSFEEVLELIRTKQEVPSRAIDVLVEVNSDLLITNYKNQIPFTLVRDFIVNEIKADRLDADYKVRLERKFLQCLGVFHNYYFGEESTESKQALLEYPEIFVFKKSFFSYLAEQAIAKLYTAIKEGYPIPVGLMHLAVEDSEFARAVVNTEVKDLFELIAKEQLNAGLRRGLLAQLKMTLYRYLSKAVYNESEMQRTFMKFYGVINHFNAAATDMEIKERCQLVFSRRARRIARTLQNYPNATNSEANKLCQAISICLEKDPRKRLKLLMHDLDDNEIRPSRFRLAYPQTIVSPEGRIHPIDLILLRVKAAIVEAGEFAPTDIFKSADLRYHWDSLTITEINLLKSRSPTFAKLVRWVNERNASPPTSCYDQLRLLRNGLQRGDIHHEGEDHHAGTPAFIAVIHFSGFFNALTTAQQNRLKNLQVGSETFKELIVDRLLGNNPSRAQTRTGINYCVQILGARLDRLIAEHRTVLKEISDSEAASNPLSKATRSPDSLAKFMDKVIAQITEECWQWRFENPQENYSAHQVLMLINDIANREKLSLAEKKTESVELIRNLTPLMSYEELYLLSLSFSQALEDTNPAKPILAHLTLERHHFVRPTKQSMETHSIETCLCIIKLAMHKLAPEVHARDRTAPLAARCLANAMFFKEKPRHKSLARQHHASCARLMF
jgi:hypothetical protein